MVCVYVKYIHVIHACVNNKMLDMRYFGDLYNIVFKSFGK